MSRASQRSAALSPDRRSTGLIAGGALLLALLVISQLYVWVNLWPGSVTWREAALYAVPQLLLWGLLIPVMAWLARRLPVEGPAAAGRVVVHIGASVLISLAGLLILDGSDRLLHWSRLMGAPGKLIADIRVTIVHLHIGVGIYWVVFAVVHALRYRDESRRKELRATRLEAELAQAQLQALRMQLNPHFLFNTLNSIGVLMRHDVDAADRMLHRLSDLLQSTLRHEGAHEVPLEEELGYLRSYVQIEETRFGDRLRVEFDIAPETLPVHVPFLLLQPLVENAVRHAVAPRAGGGRVTIESRLTDGRLRIRILDDGPGLPRGVVRPSGHGVGLRNTRRRLRKLYGTDHAFRLRNHAEGGLEVLIGIPAAKRPDRGPDRDRDRDRGRTGPGGEARMAEGERWGPDRDREAGAAAGRATRPHPDPGSRDDR